MSVFLEYKIVWMKNDPQVRQDALKLWKSLNALPPGTESDRLNSLCVVAYDGDELVAVSTIGIKYIPSVRAKIGWFRCLVRPEVRKKGVATELCVRCKNVMEEWSKNNLLEKVLGYGVVVESRNLATLSRKPIWPRTELALMGHTSNGQQMRLVWFDHAYFENNKPVKHTEPTILDADAQMN